ncbi:MAG: glycosyltransferase family 2 protein [bacterium]|nr:glycosyltransferase family 2 protein [bacterium]
MKLSIIIPVYNEIEFLPKIIEAVKKVNLPDIVKEIVIVDDASNDGTGEWIEKYVSQNPDVKFKKHNINMGKGSAIKTAIAIATGDIIVIQDADLEYNPEDYKILLVPILEGKTNVVYGSRNLRKNKSYSYIYYFGNEVLTEITNILYDTHLTDMETCYKMFTKEVVKDMDLCAKRFDFEPEFTAKVIKNGYEICEIPISYSARSREDGKKLTWKDGVKALWTLIKYRFKG